ncbi:hypothetical protein HDV57DRAFT_300179 [Trichoderma longibrachiatum]
MELALALRIMHCDVGWCLTKCDSVGLALAGGGRSSHARDLRNNDNRGCEKKKEIKRQKRPTVARILRQSLQGLCPAPLAFASSTRVTCTTANYKVRAPTRKSPS